MKQSRLKSTIFKLPIDAIRSGYYSDKYFFRVSEILKKDNRHPRTLYQFFIRSHGVVCGIDEALAVLKHCTGTYSDEEKAAGFFSQIGLINENIAGAGSEKDLKKVKALLDERFEKKRALDRLWVDKSSEITVRALCDGDRVAPWEPFMTIEGDPAWFGYLETVLLGAIARPTSTATAVKKVVEAAAGKPVLFFSARFDHHWVQATDGYAAMKAGAFGVSTDANADYWGVESLGTIPHALIAAYGGSTMEAAMAFDRHISPSVNRIVLVDWENDCIGTSLKVVEGFYNTFFKSKGGRLSDVIGPGENKIWGVRFDTAGYLRDVSVTPVDEASFGVCPELVWKARKAFDEHGLEELKIVATGGFDARRIELFEKLQVPVDVYGVGASLLREKTDVTADVVMVDSKPCAKAGRRAGDYSRLEEVDFNEI